MAAVLQSTAVRFAPRRLGHANVFVGDLERSMRFFNQVCGIEEVRREPGIGAGFLSNGNTHHDIGAMQCGAAVRVGVGGHVQIPQGRGQRPGLNHLGWEMDNEALLAAAWRRAVAAGVDIHRTADHQLAHSVYVFDPDGNLHEFYADVVDDWRTVFNPQREDLITGQWEPAAQPSSTASRWPREPERRVVPNAVFNPRRMARAVLVTPDLARLESFFTDVAGLEPITEARAEDCALLRGSATREGWDVALFAARNGRAQGLHHAVFEMPDEASLAAAEHRAIAAGAAIELITDRLHKRSVFLRDPDGMRFEFRAARPGSPVIPEDVPEPLRIYLV
jgi:catechol 2,3-dioxygenase